MNQKNNRDDDRSCITPDIEYPHFDERCKGDLFRIDFAASSRRGKRPENEDCVRCLEVNGRSIAVVADGVAGAPYGAVASRVAVGCFSDEVMSGASDREAFETADLTVSTVARWLGDYGSGATLASVSIDHGIARVLWLGDSISFLLRSGTLTCISQPMRSKDGALWKYVGQTPTCPPSMQDVELEIGDRVLLSTDGVWDTVPQHRLQEVLSSSGDAYEIANRLASEGAERGSDNSTAAVFLVRPLDEGERGRAR